MILYQRSLNFRNIPDFSIYNPRNFKYIYGIKFRKPLGLLGHTFTVQASKLLIRIENIKKRIRRIQNDKSRACLVLPKNRDSLANKKIHHISNLVLNLVKRVKSIFTTSNFYPFKGDNFLSVHIRNVLNGVARSV